MVKMAVLRGWAELQVASKEQGYLVDVVKPHIATLAPLWLSSLREFARLRFEPDISTNAAGPTSLGGSIDTIYSALNRETLLRVCADNNSLVYGDGVIVSMLILVCINSSTKNPG